MEKKEILKESYPKYEIIEVKKPKRSGKLLTGTLSFNGILIKTWTDYNKKIVYFLK